MTLDVLISGDGSVGRCLALALAAQGLQVGLRGQRALRSGDIRAYALNAASQALLARLRVWDGLAPDARTAVLDMRVHAGGRQLDFSAWNAHAEELAWIVDAAALDAQLDAALHFAPHVRRVEGDQAHDLLALCEGRDAGGRELLGVQVQERRYGHDALATRLVADTPHQGRAWQWFTESGEVLALLPTDQPAPRSSYALVWSQPADRAAQRAQALPPAFEAELLRITGHNLRLAGARECWPLRLALARPLVGEGFALLGDCAHVVHPLAGQGLNLGLADVAALAQVIAEREPWRRLGDAKLLRRYERKRIGDTWLMGELTDGLWLGMTQSPPWLRVLAAQGIQTVDRLPPLKRWLSQRAMGH
jgi:2-polyprenyl-6-methoxyphenol hydroxylase-like FAD-dependent oxidoreductase